MLLGYFLLDTIKRVNSLPQSSILVRPLVKETKSVTMKHFFQKIFSFEIICKNRIKLCFPINMFSTAETCMEK